MKKIRIRLENEQGNVALFVLGLISIMILLFLLILNLAGALIVKEQAVSTSQQAALAATATLYEELPGFILSYEKDLKKFIEEEEAAKEKEEAAKEEESPEEPAEPEVPEAPVEEKKEKSIDELIDEEAEKLSGEMADYTLNEIRNEAIDRILAKELDKGLGNGMLKEKMSLELEFDWIKSMKESARNAILANGGELDGAVMTVFEDGQIVVESSREVGAIGYNGFFAGIKESLFKSSKGPEVKFVQKLPGWEGRTYSLE
ncbi:pilus assembly protein TadG-related protein [Planococcus shenhongbingii]|uniref:Pilus assembly protein TadG-related protein n=1 Tax=Planococcus shenhongbingii TaxID=3058398 RepID=A0ABT8NAH1_9BACL|nr:pilus assembly protein TadG-related protein [Planococcus sp. N017]MDN7244891.1 pilus assembly protein TadG-related protein [Planococcus sp. N017]